MIRLELDPESRKWILLWDVYATHRDAAVLDTLKKTFPNMILLNVPASTTSELQPLDKGFNYPWKSLITKKAAKWIQAIVHTQLKNGHPESVDLRVTKGELVKSFCEWIDSATAEVESASINTAWNDCGFGDVWEPTSRHFELLAEAVNLSTTERLWEPIDTRRSNGGTVPATRIVI